ncbi:MAG: carbon monoxide dehydrogenase [Actinobacteria bacterium]|nr:carbon monoxide dehydrogenase [Actinomycetota bacterium]
MPTTIAVAGKGGVGKTTVAALAIKHLAATGRGPTLAIDADPSSNLNMALGLDLDWTVGDIREGLLAKVRESVTAGGAAMGGLPEGVSKREYLDYEVRSSLSEGRDFDLIAMGRSEGPGCYCAVNHNLREVIDAIGEGYRYVVIDNEAGMEHLSRRTTRDVKHLLIVSDPSHRGIVAAGRIAGFRRELDIHIENAYLIVNRVPADGLPPALQEAVDKVDAPLLGTIPEAGDIRDFDVTGRPLVEVEGGSPVYRAVAEMLETIL